MTAHSFHIPVMGIGFTIDTPLKVSQYGINSVISLVDDMLMEKVRKALCESSKLPYTEIGSKIKDHRAKRITAYLNLINTLARKKFDEIRTTAFKKGGELITYLDLLPESSPLKPEFKKLNSDLSVLEKTKLWVEENISMGDIDVNIMTKLDRENYKNKEKLPSNFNDAHAALRGFANSDLKSSIILSAGMNAQLYTYMANFEDFFPDRAGNINKKIILKVSDYRSAVIQGKFLAKKGLWVSEYRVESGLNCGGHAFATKGNLMGPILAEFRDKRQELIQAVHKIYATTLSNMNRRLPVDELPVKISAQGGVGTAAEHNFLISHYHIDSVGWGTPFLLVPEVTNVDEKTLEKLELAKEKDLSLSDISPLGIPFNSLNDNSKDQEKRSLIEKGKPGSPCPKRYVGLNFEFSEEGLCTASRKYQASKLKDIEKEDISPEERRLKLDKITEKSCICVGLGTSALLLHNIDTSIEGKGISVCPGPNMAYFSKKMSLKEITNHIYGRSNSVVRTDRPNMFIKELSIYLTFLRNKIDESQVSRNMETKKYLATFTKNLEDGIDYYFALFSKPKNRIVKAHPGILVELELSKNILLQLKNRITNLFPATSILGS